MSLPGKKTKTATRRTITWVDGKPRSVFLDDETGLLVTNLTNYEVKDEAGNPIKTSSEEMTEESDKEIDDKEPLEHKLRRKRFEEDDTDPRGSNVKRTPENNFGWAEKSTWMKYSGFAPGFLGKAASLIDKGINANNVMAEAAARKHYGIEGDSLGENAKETFKGADGFIGNVKVGDELVAISLSGQPLESGRPTLKPQQLDERIRATGEQITEAAPEEVEAAEQEATVKYGRDKQPDKSLFDQGFDQVAGIFDKKTSAAPSIHTVGTNPDSLNQEGFAGNIVGEDNEGVATAETAREAAPSQGGGFADLLPSRVEYANQGTRDKPITSALDRELAKAVQHVYGPGYTAQVYSGAQMSKADAIAAGAKQVGDDWWLNGEKVRTGSVRHDEGGAGAADVYVIGPDGEHLVGDQLAPLARHWAATKTGGVGLEMKDGGIHLDLHKVPPDGGSMFWSYGGLTEGQQKAKEDGLAGIPVPPMVAPIPPSRTAAAVASVPGQGFQPNQTQTAQDRTNTPNPKMGIPNTVASAPVSEPVQKAESPKPDEQVTAMARTIAGELGQNTIQAILSGDPVARESARSEIAGIVSTMNNRASSSRYASLENPMLEGVLDPSQYNSLMAGNKKTTDNNYSLVGDFVNQAVMDAVSGALPSPAPKATHYRSIHMDAAPAWEKHAIDGTKQAGEHIFSTVAVPGTNRPEYEKAFRANLPEKGPIVPDRGFNIPASPPIPTANPNKVNRGAEMIRPIGFAQPEPNKPLNFPGPPPVSRSPEYRRADDPNDDLFDIEREPKMAPMGGYTGTQGVPSLRGWDKGPRNVPLTAMEEFKKTLPETDPFAGDEPFELPIDETNPDKISYSWDIAENVKKEAITPKNSIMAPPVPTPSQPGIQNKMNNQVNQTSFKESFAKPEEGLRPELQNTRQAQTVVPLGDIKGFGSTDKVEGGLVKDLIEKVVPRSTKTRVPDPIRKESVGPAGAKNVGSGLSAMMSVRSGMSPVGTVARSASNPSVMNVSMPHGNVAHINDEFGYISTWSPADDDERGTTYGTQLAISPDGKQSKSVSPEKATALAAQGWSIYGKGATGKSGKSASKSTSAPSTSKSGGFLGGLFGGKSETSSSKSSSSASRSGGFSSRGDLGSGTPGRSGGGDGEGKVLCGYFYGKGRIPKKILLADLKYAETMPEDTRKGYLVWAKPLVAFLEKKDSRILDNMIFPFTKGWVYEMAYRMGAHPTRSLWGRMVTNVGEFVCNKIGKFV